MPEPVDPGLRLVLADELAPRRQDRLSTTYTGRAEREATAIIAEHTPATTEDVHTAITLAWLKGYLAAGYEVMALIGHPRPDDTTPTTDRS